MQSKKIRAFTISELMTTLALTGIMLSFVYMGYTYIQRLLKQFNEQSYFITQLNELNKRFIYLSNQHSEIIFLDDNKFSIKTDSSEYILKFDKKNILVTKESLTDTFKLEALDIKTDFEPLASALPELRLVKAIRFDVLFQKQRFNLVFTKQYDAYSKLKHELSGNN